MVPRSTHRPEQTTPYRLVQQHTSNYFACTEVCVGARFPGFVKDEFGASLNCGIVTHGFLWLRCDECAQYNLLAQQAQQAQQAQAARLRSLSDERVLLNPAGHVELKPKTLRRGGTTHLVMCPLEFIQRLAALAPRPRLRPNG